MKKLLIIDRDGTLIKEPKDQQIDDYAKLEFLPQVISTLRKIEAELDYELIMVTNQDGLGTKAFPENTFWPVHNLMLKTFENEDVKFKEILIDKSFAKEKSPNRKPETGLLKTYIEGDYNLENSYVIGDRITDIKLAQNLNSKAIYIDDGQNLGEKEVKNELQDLQETIDLKTNSWDEIYEFLKYGQRQAKITRKTKETNIELMINLDGTGESEISTGISFFDHMLDQIAKHGQIDIQLSVEGDLEVDEHHTIEDTAIALGEAFKEALADKLGIERYGFCLPMDDALAQVAIDFGGRNWLEWQADFKREMIGKMPTEMFMHFFKSFSDGAQANLNIKAEGINEHHKIEAIFKAFAKAIKMAVKRDTSKMILPTTKGKL
ncbi:bifunctional imidazole glycerol-phosphate dehydratase/histidinol phosphatase [Psychroflexus sp. S27]|uniref:bifunctional histidinol-phosphatase/imidazoleglycerol-phosphate dehydratase HisB n=1 Tax=Psychroflexus sp. S27 TaxID=1982757 RepID=UPI000C2A063A|nr:bifunctional histidinol-phosphatase/imidazoleglycerol-phosphate dehydratase HisB [Psychroflexus sp. S27]PJX28552.1 bifunctional imidazole glycerol-phosphate dehydratase/histidinol phosphatase [Psychroflexus sp. S27]